MKNSLVISLLSSVFLFSTQCFSVVVFFFFFFCINFMFSNVCMIKPLDAPGDSIL